MGRWLKVAPYIRQRETTDIAGARCGRYEREEKPGLISRAVDNLEKTI